MKRPLLLLLAALALNATAADMDFTYDTFGGIRKKFGHGRAETINVAVFVGPELEGRKITGLNVPLYAQTDKVTDISGWTSSELKQELKDRYAYNVPDGVSAAGTVGDDNMLRVTFDTPVTVPAQGIYVGYTYRATTKLSGTSAAMVDGNRRGECFYLSSRARKTWGDLYESSRLASAMTVTMEGDFAADDASVRCDAPVLGIDTKAFEATVVNNGTSPLKSITYSYSTDKGVSGTGTVTLDKEIAPVYGRGVNVALPLENITENGVSELTLTITGVNGNAVTGGKKLQGTLTAQWFVPVFRPVVEEYTYLGCGYCPRGYVMLEQMKSKYGSRFVGVSYHSSGHEHGYMACIEDEKTPLGALGGYPAASLNRGSNVDPSSVPSPWISMKDQTTTCAIDATLAWSDESHSQLTLTGNARFLNDLPEHTYRIAWILVGDGLSHPTWRQSNYYNKQEPTGIYTEPFWDLFVGQPDKINTLVFNDIALAASDYKGVEGSIPAEIVAGKQYPFSYTFQKDDIRNIRGQEIVSDYDRVRCIALIVDSNTGRVANCISTLYPDGADPFAPREDIDWTPVIEEDNEPGDSGVDGVDADANAATVQTLYYSLDGLEVTAPAKGSLLIRVEILDNGSARYSKIIF